MRRAPSPACGVTRFGLVTLGFSMWPGSLNTMTRHPRDAVDNVFL